MEAPKLRRLTASLLMALSIASCGGGDSTGATPAAGLASTASTQTEAAAPAVSAEAKDAAAKVAAGGRAETKAVAAALASFQAFRADRIQQVIVFGDSLSDAGTYRAGLIAQAGGGKFTTNPGPVWPETVGLLLGTSVKPFYQGFGGPVQIPIALGTDFAMVGARVSQQPGIGCKPDPRNGLCTAAPTFPVTRQVSDSLYTHAQSFTRDQMVFIFAGSNDLRFQFDRYAHGLQTASQTQTAVIQAANDLAGQLRLIVATGATRVSVLSVPDLAYTIAGRSLDPAIAATLSGWVTDFNATLIAGIGSAVKVIDTYAEFKRVLADSGRFGISVVNVPACDLEAIAESTGQPLEHVSSLFCSPLTLVEPNAAFRYFYADTEHPTTLGHLIISC